MNNKESSEKIQVLISQGPDKLIQLFNETSEDFFKILIQLGKTKNVPKKDINKMFELKNIYNSAITVNKAFCISEFSEVLFTDELKEFIPKLLERNEEFFIALSVEREKISNHAQLIKLTREIFIVMPDSEKEVIFSYLEDISLIAYSYVLSIQKNKNK